MPRPNLPPDDQAWVEAVSQMATDDRHDALTHGITAAVDAHFGLNAFNTAREPEARLAMAAQVNPDSELNMLARRLACAGQLPGWWDLVYPEEKAAKIQAKIEEIRAQKRAAVARDAGTAALDDTIEL